MNPNYWIKGQVTSQIVARGLRYAMERKQAEVALHRAAETERAARVAVQVVNNMVVLQRDLQAVSELLRLYQQTDAGLAQQQPELHQHIQQAAEAMDVESTPGKGSCFTVFLPAKNLSEKGS